MEKAHRVLSNSPEIERRILQALSKGASRHSELVSLLEEGSSTDLTPALERLQQEGLVRRRSGDGEGPDIHRYELSGLGRHTQLAIDEIEGG